MNYLTRLNFFPEIKITNRNIPLYLKFLSFIVLTGVYYLLALWIPCNGFFCWDWIYVFSKDLIPGFYPPWTGPIVTVLNYPLLIGLTMAAVSLAAFMRAKSLFSLFCVFLCLPVLWVIFLGQLEGLVVLGLIGLPWLAPLALLKPQVSAFAFLSNKKYIIALLIVLVLSMVIWGFWPLKMLSVNQFYAEGRYPQDISFGLWGFLPGLVLIWFSRGDMDMLMLAGSVMTFHLIPYNLLPVVPAVARLSKRSAGLAVLLSWTTFSSNWIGPIGWWFGWTFVFLIWICLAAQRYEHKKWATYLNRWVGYREN
jgi:hypothetical protein